MRQIDVVYSPMCEATAAMVEKLRIWLEGTDIQINLIIISCHRIKKFAKM